MLAHLIAKHGADSTARQAAVSFAMAASAVAGAVTTVAVVALGFEFLEGPALVVIGVATFLLFLATTPAGWMQGTGAFASLASVRVLEGVVKVAVGIAAGAVGGGVAGAILGFAAGAAAVLLVGSYQMRRDLTLQRPDFKHSGILRMTVGMTAVQGLAAAMTSVDVVLVAVLPVPAEQAANYHAAAVLGRTPLFLAGGIAAALFPLLGATSSAPALARRARDLYVALVLPVVAIMMTVPAPVLAVVLPVEYDRVTPLLTLLAPAGAAIGFMILDATLLQSQQRYGLALRCLLAGLAFAGCAAVVGWHVAGPSGIAAGALIAALLNAALLRRCAGRDARRPWGERGIAVAMGTGIVITLVLVRHEPLLWLPLSSAVVGAVSLSSVRRRRGAGPGDKGTR